MILSKSVLHRGEGKIIKPRQPEPMNSAPRVYTKSARWCSLASLASCVAVAAAALPAPPLLSSTTSAAAGSTTADAVATVAPDDDAVVAAAAVAELATFDLTLAVDALADSKSRRTRRFPRDPLSSWSAPTARNGTATCKEDEEEGAPSLLVPPRPQTYVNRKNPEICFEKG